MTDTFFTGGTLPSNYLLLYFQDHLRIDKHWVVRCSWFHNSLLDIVILYFSFMIHSGVHYQKTLEAWLIEIDKKKSEVMLVLQRAYGKENALKW